MLVEQSPALGSPGTAPPPAPIVGIGAAFADNALFDGLQPAVLHAICERIEVLTLSPAEILFKENDDGDCMYLILKGSIKISKRGRGRHKETLAHLLANDYFGEMALVDGGTRSAEASAVGETILGRIDRAAWEYLLQLAPQNIFTNFIRSFSQRLRDNNQHFVDEMTRRERAPAPIEKLPMAGELTVVPPPSLTLGLADAFAANSLFADLNPAVLHAMSERIEMLTLAPDQVLFEENAPGDCLYLILQGSIKISKRGRGGKQETLTYLLANDYFGEMALVDGGTRSAQATAVGETIVGRVDRATWKFLLQLAPQNILTNFTRSVTQRLRQNNQHFIDQMLRSERLSLIGTTISSIVHDMNNPISTILCACGIIQSTAADATTMQLAGHIKDAVDRMAAMTRELVDYSRGQTQLKLESVDVREFVRQLDPDFNKCRVGCKVEVQVEFEGSIKIDRHRMLRVFGNLIKNAREAMNADQKNCLRFSVRKIESEALFEVSDTGHGIRSELLPKIFEPFVTDGKAQGTGLGLAIAKTVVDAHGGTITVESSPAGTTFRITLPIPSEGETS